VKSSSSRTAGSVPRLYRTTVWAPINGCCRACMRGLATHDDAGSSRWVVVIGQLGPTRPTRQPRREGRPVGRPGPIGAGGCHVGIRAEGGAAARGGGKPCGRRDAREEQTAWGKGGGISITRASGSLVVIRRGTTGPPSYVRLSDPSGVRVPVPVPGSQYACPNRMPIRMQPNRAADHASVWPASSSGTPRRRHHRAGRSPCPCRARPSASR